MEELLLRLGMPAAWIEVLELGLLGRLLLAAVLGGLIGLERELSGKPAGLRTNLLICVGAALLMELSVRLAADANAVNVAAGAVFRADPGRIAAQIVSGIGFLGAGTILQARGTVVGLTTAATIWVVAAIGMAVGAREYMQAAGATLLVFLSLVSLGRLENLLVRRRQARAYRILLDVEPAVLQHVQAVFRERGLHVEVAAIEKLGDRFEVLLDVQGPIALQDGALRELLARPGVTRVARAD